VAAMNLMITVASHLKLHAGNIELTANLMSENRHGSQQFRQQSCFCKLNRQATFTASFAKPALKMVIRANGLFPFSSLYQHTKFKLVVYNTLLFAHWWI
jgi:hypothetical protein